MIINNDRPVAFDILDTHDQQTLAAWIEDNFILNTAMLSSIIESKLDLQYIPEQWFSVPLRRSTKQNNEVIYTTASDRRCVGHGHVHSQQQPLT